MTLFTGWNKRVGSAAIFENLNIMTNKEVTVPDDIVFALVDGGFDDTVFVFGNGRYSCLVDDWLECDSNNGLRTMHLSVMDRI